MKRFNHQIPEQRRPGCGDESVSRYDARLFSIPAMCDEHEIPQGVTPLTKTRPTSWHRPSGPTGPRKEICPQVAAASSTLTILAFNTWRLLFYQTPIWPKTNTRAVPITPGWTKLTRDRSRTTTSTTTTSRTASTTSVGKRTRGKHSTRSRSSTFR